MKINRLNEAQLKMLSDWSFYALDIAPYIASVLYTLRYASCDDLVTETMSSSYETKTILINFDGMVAVEGCEGHLDPRIGGWYLLHFVMHFVFDHHNRGLTTDPLDLNHDRWETSTDLETNVILYESSGILLPDTQVYPENLDMPSHLGAESYYLRLPEDMHFDSDMSGDDDSNAGSGQSLTISISLDGHGSGSEPGEGENEDSSGDGDDDDDKPAIEGCGSAANADDQAQSTVDQMIRSIFTNTVTPDVANAIQNAVEQMKLAGALPLEISTKIGRDVSIPIKRVDWLRRYMQFASMRASGGIRNNWKRPSRRWRPTIASGRVFVPRKEGRKINITLVADTSGSMTEKDLALITDEVLGIIATIGPRKVRLTLRSWDVEGHGDVIARIGDVEYDYVGRGGTDMVAALDQIASNREKPDLVIVATDGFLMRPWPRQAVLACPVVVCLIGEASASLDSLPDWISGFRGEEMQERSTR